MVQTLAWVLIAHEGKAPILADRLQRALQASHEAPLRALWSYPQGWLLGITMFSLASTWTTVVTFLPTLLLERGVALALGGPVLACLYYGGLFPVPPSPGSWLAWCSSASSSWVPALCNTMLGIAIVLTSSPWLLMGLLTGMGGGVDRFPHH